MFLKKINAHIELSRIKKPTGIALLYIPCLWGICAYEQNPINILKKAFLFLIGALSLRTCGCIINDIWDKDFDKFVERTKNRPLTNGNLSILEALIAFSICILPGFYVFTTLSFNAKLISLFGLFLAIIYPLCKRFTHFPQVFLGFTFNIGIWVAGIDCASCASLTILYCAGIFWTLAYDTIYAFQDISDDEKVGIKSTAVFFKSNPKTTIFFFYSAMFSFLLINNIYFEKTAISFPIPNYTLTIVIYFYTLFLIYNWKPNDTKNCHLFFKKNIAIGFGVI